MIITMNSYSVTSKDNPKIKEAARLTSDASYRRKTGLFTLEGLRLISDAAGAGIRFTLLFVSSSAREKYDLSALYPQADELISLPDELFAKLSDTQSPQGILAVAEQFATSPADVPLDIMGRYIALEHVADPGNLGTVIRTAGALGLSGVIVSGGCDVFSPKTQRAAMGAVFRLPVIVVDSMPGFIAELREKDFACLATTVGEGASDIGGYPFPENTGVVAVLGNEANGLTDACVAACDAKVTIPMADGAESLNVAGAAAIISYLMRQGKDER